MSNTDKKKQESRMDAIFNKFKKRKKNDNKTLMEWMKEANLLDATKKEAERRVGDLFRALPDPKDVEFPEFKEIITTVAAEVNEPIKKFTNKLLSKAQDIMKTWEERSSDELQSSDDDSHVIINLGLGKDVSTNTLCPKKDDACPQTSRELTQVPTSSSVTQVSLTELEQLRREEEGSNCSSEVNHLILTLAADSDPVSRTSSENACPY